MTALHHHHEAAPVPCRSRVTGRYMPATRQLADRIEKVEASVTRAFDALQPIGALVERAAAGPLGPKDVEALRTAHEVLWSALDKVGDDLGEVRDLLGMGSDA